MSFNPEIHHRRTIRLGDYDYTRAGAYFVTLCTFGRQCLFGEIADGAVRLNDLGRVVEEEWLMTAALRDTVLLDEFIIMPNHFHAILLINDTRRGTACRALECADDKDQGTARRAPTVESFGWPVAGSLATIIRSFKSAVTRRVNLLRDNPGVPLWQRNYFERVIRHDRELSGIRQYIADNPTHWEKDENYPARHL